MTLYIIHGLLDVTSDVISDITQGVIEVTSASWGHTFAKQIIILALFLSYENSVNWRMLGKEKPR